MSPKKPIRRAERETAAASRNRAAVAEAIALAVKRDLVTNLQRVLKRDNISQSELARRMRTSRAVVHRLLKRDDPSVTLATISRAAMALGCSMKVTLRD